MTILRKSALIALLSAALVGCAAKKVNHLVAHKPTVAESKFWRGCEEVASPRMEPETKTFQCVDADGILYLARFTRLSQ